MIKFTKYFLIALVICNLTACGVLNNAVASVSNFVFPKGNRLEWRSVSVLSASDANLNSALAVDVVLVRDDATLAMLASMPASKWFVTRGEIQKTFPQALSVHSMEIAPGQTLRLPSGAFGEARVTGVFVFADYLTPGEHRVRMDQLQGDVLVQLAARDFTVSAQPTK